MTPSDLEAIEARSNAATPGPWAADCGGYIETTGQTGFANGIIVAHTGPFGVEDAAFIASSRVDIPALIAEVRRLQVLVTHWENRACTCGSGGHPRHCKHHPEGFDAHCRELSLEAEVEGLREENERLKEAAVAFGDDLSVHPTSAYARLQAENAARPREPTLARPGPRCSVLGAIHWGAD